MNWFNEKMEVTRISCHDGKNRMEKTLKKFRNTNSFIALKYGMLNRKHEKSDKFDEFMRSCL